MGFCGDNMKANFRDLGWGSVELIYLAQDTEQWRALVYTVMNLLVP
jgi:hypothetical protein